jgi:hypothetical protein
MGDICSTYGKFLAYKPEGIDRLGGASVSGRILLKYIQDK